MYKTNKISMLLIMISFLSTSNIICANNIELNDPQVLSIIITINQIEIKNGELALNKSNNEEIKEFAKTKVDNFNMFLDKVLFLKKELIVAPQLNIITRFFINEEVISFQTLRSKDENVFNISYIDNEVAFHERVLLIMRDILLPQVRNEKLKRCLIELLPLLENHLERAEKTKLKIESRSSC